MTRKLLLVWMLLVCSLASAAQRNVLQARNEQATLLAVVVASDEAAHLWLLPNEGNKLPDGSLLHATAAYATAPPRTDVVLAERLSPIPADYAEPSAAKIERENDLQLEWSNDGQAISLLHRGEAIAFVTLAEARGYSKAVGKSYQDGQPWDEARYQQLFRPKDRASLLKRGVALHDTGDFAGALAVYEQILATDPKDVTILYEAGASAMSSNNPALCLDYALRGQRASDKDTPLETRVALRSVAGSCYDMSGKLDEAIAEFEAGLVLAPRDTYTHFNAAVTLAKVGRMDRARGHLKAAMNSSPAYGSPYLVYAQLLDKEANPAVALPLYLRYMMLEPASPQRTEVAQYVVGLLRLAGRQKELEPTTTDAADKSTGKALVAPFAAAARELESASADTLTGEQLVAALRSYVLRSLEVPATAVSAFVSSAALEPLQGMEKDGVLTTYLYLVATNANLAGSREWLQGHRTELAALIGRLSTLKSNAKAPR